MREICCEGCLISRHEYFHLHSSRAVAAAFDPRSYVEPGFTVGSLVAVQPWYAFATDDDDDDDDDDGAHASADPEENGAGEDGDGAEKENEEDQEREQVMEEVRHTGQNKQ